MDAAIAELKRTILAATDYIGCAIHHIEEIRSHVEALTEDASVVGRHKSTDEAEDIMREARRTKRDLERLAFPLSRAKEEQLLRLRQEELETAKKSTGATLATLERAPKKQNTAVKLPAIKLPVFTGEVEQWRGFKQMLHDLLEEDGEMPSAKKWLLLREHLGGKALELVQELPTSPETYKIALDLLEQSYGSVNKAVTSLYLRLQAIPATDMNHQNIRLTSAKVDGMLRSLEIMGEDVENNRFLRTVVVSKYPIEIQRALKVKDDMELSKFRKKIAGYIATNENSLDLLQKLKPATEPSQSNQSKKFFWKKSNSERSTAPDNKCASSSSAPEAPPPKKPALSSGRPKRCSFCEAEHYSDQCENFKTVEQRKQKLGNRCPICFRVPHPGKDCSRVIKCAYCGETTHNRALCPKRVEKTCAVRDVVPAEPVAPIEATCTIRDHQYAPFDPLEKEHRVESEVANAGYVTFMVDTYASPVSKTGENIRAVVDTGSRGTLITEALAKKLRLKINKNSSVQLFGLANVPNSKKPNPTCKLYLRPPLLQPIVIEAIIVEHIIDNIVAPSVADFKQQNPKYEHLPMPSEGNGEEIQLLIGTRTLLPILTLQYSITVSPSIQLMATKFGWLILGGLEEPENEEKRSVTSLIMQSYDPIKLMCELDTVGLKGLEQTSNEEESIALDKFYDSLKFDTETNRYEVGLPYRYDPIDLADNFGLAWGRLKSLHKKLSNTPDLLAAYDQQIKQQLAADVIEVVDRFQKPPNQTHYIAHQVVIKMDTSTPVRLVLNASAHLPGLRSLNDNILKGANWVDDMPSLLIRFRKEEVAVTADVSKAFHQLSIRPQDRDICRFIWLIDINKPPTSDNLQIFRFKRLAFGLASSPFLLYATIKYHIRQNPHEYTNILECDIYADNLVTSVSSSTNFEEFFQKIKGTFSSMSMDLTKWNSNSEKLLSYIPEKDQFPEKIQTVLGMSWDTQTDKMRLQMKNCTFPAHVKLTKRRILSEAAAVFDPLGWVMPVIIMARIFIRKVWALNGSWDQTLPPEVADEWLQIRKSLTDVTQVIIDRKMFANITCIHEEMLEMHVFSDASVEAYAVVVFLRYQENVSFVASKARLTPKAALSVPRLELIAAVMASRYAAYVTAALKMQTNLKVSLWTDSKCILSWLKTTKILPAYVQKSIAEIRNGPISSYRYVPTGLNPADVASRGATVSVLQTINWWNGPIWLRSTDKWPIQDCTEEAIAEKAAIELNDEDTALLTRVNIAAKKFNPKEFAETPFTLDPRKFNRFEQLLKRSSYILHAVNRIFLRSKLKRKPIAVENEKTDYTVARRIWLRWDQKRAYTEIPLNRRSNVAYLRNISVLQDEQGLLRCTTRIQNSAETAQTVQPILLVKDSPITTLIVMSIHMNNLHAGTAHTLAALRRTYWLPHGRQQVYKIINTFCSTCRIHRAKPFALPEMAPLPEFRIKKTETPFRNVGVDTFGPILCKNPTNPKEKKKKYVIIFTCMIVRAVHLEVLDDMTSIEFLTAFRRFVARRGTPSIVVSDNAPQFGVIERRFVDTWRYISEKNDIVNYFAKEKIQWKFIPPHSPWMGGVYERLIKSVKLAFEKTHRDISLTTKQLRTIVIEIEGMLNSRPISYVDKNLETPVITPNHFLQVKYPAIPTTFEEADIPEVAYLWKAAEEYLNTYWQFWSQYYVRSLRERLDDMHNPHSSTSRVPQVGDVVLMVDPNRKRSNWMIAIVERLVYSEDKKVRSVQIYKIDGGRMIRPINTLLPLDVVTDLPDVHRMKLNAARKVLVHQLGESDDEDIDDNLQQTTN